MQRWQFSIDVGGTFTDCFATAPDGSHRRAKVLSASTEPSPLVAIRQVLRLQPNDSIPPVVVRLGTTKGTNALLTRTGARIAWVTTRGFADVLEIGDQSRPQLFALDIRKPPPIYEAVAEIDERLAADGSVLRKLELKQAQVELERLRGLEIESLAICLLHAYKNPVHERQLAQLARSIGFRELSVSHEVSPSIKIVPRGNTTVADAYLNPVLRDYLQQVAAALGPDSELLVLTSAGGLVRAENFRGKDSLLSGPAGGVVGFAAAAQAAGVKQAIGFDMGGTSTDVSRYSGQFELVSEIEKNGLSVVAPALAIETVAAGGGSICRFDGTKLVVGPASAGADPGPACYGRGGPLALTDMNLALGRLRVEHFPFPLDRDTVMRQLGELAMEINAATGQRLEWPSIAQGFLRIANFRMVKAIQSISVAKGVDPRDHALVCFGGAAPQHACEVAAELGIRTVLIHPDASILSAVGASAADVVRHRMTHLDLRVNRDGIRRADAALAALSTSTIEDVRGEGVAHSAIEAQLALDVRYVGNDAALTVPTDPGGDVSQAFHAAHQALFGYADPARDLELVAARVRAVGRVAARPATTPRVEPVAIRAERTEHVIIDGQDTAVAIFDRERLPPGARHAGPALIIDRFTTTFVDRGWRFDLLGDGQLRLTGDACRSSSGKTNDVAEADPITLEVFNQAFAAIATQMGITLRNTSSSVNVKERLDFSCAIFTKTGDLVVNAPHMPVHLGAMSETVRCVLADHPDLAAGDVIVTNDPYRGGSHLPDLTVVTPVFGKAGDLRFLTASRAHHAEIGGIAPGSMPADSKTLADEGVLILSRKLVVGGESRLGELQSLLESSPYPSRDVVSNLRDVEAQIAANRRGATHLLALIEKHGRATVDAYMHHIQNAAERKIRSALIAIPDGAYRFADQMDDGAPIAVTVTIAGDSADIDFAGTAGVHPGNLNANRAIVSAAVIYVLRCLLQEDIPLNQGVMRPVRLRIPEGMLAPPKHESPQQCAAVAGGNVETSQRVVDVLLAALQLAAGSQGTMNNLLFGNESFGYYGTICGGAGATPNADGASAVHTHMTNTRLTDPEILEQRYPVRLCTFRIRPGSGGKGRHVGGNGVIREIQFLQPVTVSILSQRRVTAPFGLAGGQSGQPGVNRWVRADGTETTLPSIASVNGLPGDRIVIETPGGGAWGEM
jgi:5-oxoprolinase (ATP-hydrolysing)